MSTITSFLKPGKVALLFAALMVSALIFESCSSGNSRGGSASRSKAKSKNDRIKRNTSFMTY